MLIYSMGASIDGFVMDRAGGFQWSVPSEDQFAVHLELTQQLGAHLLGRRLYETMQVWEDDPAFREDPLEARFADAWTALPKVVFSRSLTEVHGTGARLAEGSLAEEVARARAGTDLDVGVGGADLGAQAFAQGLVDELHVFRNPVVVGGGTPMLPPVGSTVRMELLETRTFASRVVFERWGRAQDA